MNYRHILQVSSLVMVRTEKEKKHEVPNGNPIHYSEVTEIMISVIDITAFGGPF